MKEIAIFECGLCTFGKDFEKISKMVVGCDAAESEERREGNQSLLRRVEEVKSLPDVQTPQETGL